MKKSLFLSAILVAGMVLVACNDNEGTKTLNLPQEEVNGVVMLKIPAGSFNMGDNDGYENETPVHRVKISEFWMSQTEITNAQYARFLNEAAVSDEQVEKYINTNYYGTDYSGYLKLKLENGVWQAEAGYEDVPVVLVTWYGAEAYCNWGGFRLPTEAEWEYAAKGGQDYRYSGSDNLQEVAWYSANSGKEVHPVGQKKANRFGLYDMSGNVWEWCADRYGSSYYAESPEKDPQGPATGSGRVYRGGGWCHAAIGCRVAYRYYFFPENVYYYLGFRVARSSK